MTEQSNTGRRDTVLKIADAAIDQVTTPGNFFSTGNWTAVAGNPDASLTDNIVAGTALVLTASGTLKDSLNNKPISSPFYSLAAVNGILAVSTFVKTAQGGFENHGGLVLAISLLGWSIGHLCKGIQKQRNTKPKTVLDDGDFHYGYGDIAIVHVEPPPGGINAPAIAAAGLGLAKTFMDRTVPEFVENTIPDWVNKNVTPTRLYAVSYVLGSVGSAMVTEGATAMSNPNMVKSQLQIAWAYVNFDSGFDRMAKNLTRRVLGKPLIDQENPPHLTSEL